MRLGIRYGYVPLRRDVLSALDSKKISGREFALFVALLCMVSHRKEGDGDMFAGHKVPGGVWVGNMNSLMDFMNGNTKRDTTQTFRNKAQLDTSLRRFQDELKWIRKFRVGQNIVIVINKFEVVGKNQKKYKTVADNSCVWHSLSYTGVTKEEEQEMGGFNDLTGIVNTSPTPNDTPDPTQVSVSEKAVTLSKDSHLGVGLVSGTGVESDTHSDTPADTDDEDYRHVGVEVPLESSIYEFSNKERIKKERERDRGAKNGVAVAREESPKTPISPDELTQAILTNDEATLRRIAKNSAKETYRIALPEEGVKGVSRQFNNALNRPPDYKKYHDNWLVKFELLVKNYDVRTLAETIHWIFYVDEWGWAEKLLNRWDQDPMQWLLEDNRWDKLIRKARARKGDFLKEKKVAQKGDTPILTDPYERRLAAVAAQPRPQYGYVDVDEQWAELEKLGNESLARKKAKAEAEAQATMQEENK